jgi:GNAT superfamily N-acetyltransferase
MIISVAKIELLQGQEAALRRLATDKPYQKQGYGTYLMKILEKWVKLQEYSVLKLHTDLQTEQFYRKLGYNSMPFVEPNVPANIIDLGKIL